MAGASDKKRSKANAAALQIALLGNVGSLALYVLLRLLVLWMYGGPWASGWLRLLWNALVMWAMYYLVGGCWDLLHASLDSMAWVGGAGFLAGFCGVYLVWVMYTSESSPSCSPTPRPGLDPHPLPAHQIS
jgi:hypothetical protein